MHKTSTATLIAYIPEYTQQILDHYKASFKVSNLLKNIFNNDKHEKKKNYSIFILIPSAGLVFITFDIDKPDSFLSSDIT